MIDLEMYFLVYLFSYFCEIPLISLVFLRVKLTSSYNVIVVSAYHLPLLYFCAFLYFFLYFLYFTRV